MSVAATQQDPGHRRTMVFSGLLLSVFIMLVAASALLSVTAESSDADIGDKFDDGEWSGGAYVYTLKFEVTSVSPDEVKIYGCNNLNVVGKYKIPSTIIHNSVEYSITSIGKNAFSGCNEVTELTVGDNIRSIGESAFYGCSSLRTLYLGTETLEVGNQAFKDCTSLVSVMTGKEGSTADKLTAIKSEAFSGCISLRTYRVGVHVATIENFAFKDCYHLVEICNNSSSLYLEIGSSSNGGIAKYAVNIYSSGSGNPIVDTITIGGLNVAYYTDSKGTFLIAVDNPSSSMTLPDSILGKSYSIRMYAFMKISGITSVVLGAGTTQIGDFAFSSCYDLSSITLNSGLTDIGENAFSSCPYLTSITIPDTVTYLGSNIFSNCIMLSQISLGTGVTGIPNNAFSGCSSITSFDYGDQVIAFGNGAFQDCISLSSITIKKNIIAIMNGTFAGCTELKGSSSSVRVCVLATAVPDIGSDAFPVGTYITVPSEKLEAYKSGWSQYADTIVSDTFDVVFMNGNEVFHSYTAHYGDTVTLPSTQPTKESTDKCDYKFNSWSGYTEGMKVTGNMKFDAVYDEIPKDVPGSGGSNSSSTTVIIVVIVVAVLAAIGVAVFLLKRKGHS